MSPSAAFSSYRNPAVRQPFMLISIDMLGESGLRGKTSHLRRVKIPSFGSQKSSLQSHLK